MNSSAILSVITFVYGLAAFLYLAGGRGEVEPVGAGRYEGRVVTANRQIVSALKSGERRFMNSARLRTFE